MTKIDRLKKILKEENRDNYSNMGISPEWVTLHIEKILYDIEWEVFGSTKIQKKQCEKMRDRLPNMKVAVKK